MELQVDNFCLFIMSRMVCRLTPPLCLNFLGLIHMDSHIIKNNNMETHYTQVLFVNIYTLVTQSQIICYIHSYNDSVEQIISVEETVSGI